MSNVAPPSTADFLLDPARGVNQVRPDVFCLSCPVPFDVGTVNTYLLTGDPLTLIDTGSRINWSAEDLAALFTRAGHDLRDLQQLVLTHRHIDHFGIANQVKALSGARIISSRLDGPFMARWEDHAIRSRAELKKWGAAFGIPDDLFDINEDVWKRIAWSAESVESDQLVGGGDVIEGGGRRLHVIESPGHTEGLITLFDKTDGTYFSNDHVLRHITPNPDVYEYDPRNLRSGLPDYVESLRGVRDLPATLILPGHGHEMTDLAGRVDEILLHHEARADKVLGILRDRPSTVFEVVGRIWETLRPQDSHLAVREIIGHLVLLERDGRATHELGQETLVYSPT